MPAKNKNVESVQKEESLREMTVLSQPDIFKGVYTNLAYIHHTENEFLIDFFLKFAGQTQLVSRVIMSPAHMAAFKKALVENINNFESKYRKKMVSKSKKAKVTPPPPPEQRQAERKTLREYAKRHKEK